MPVTNYKPKIGETVFVSLSGHEPILITVTGFHYHTYLGEEVMDYTRLNGEAGWSGYKKNTFYPEIPVDTPYMYFLVLSQEDNYDNRYLIDEAFFFTPEEAFSYQDDIKNGIRKSKHEPNAHYENFTVEVRKVT